LWTVVATFMSHSPVRDVETESLKNVPPPDSRLLSDWIALHLKLVRNTKGLSQGALFRHFSYSSIAFYESIVQSDVRFVSTSGQLQGLGLLPQLRANKNTSWQASANAAIATMLKAFYGANPVNLEMIALMEKSNNEMLAKVGFSNASISTAGKHGVSVANEILEWSKQDGSTTQHPPYHAPQGDGLWEPTPPAFAPPAGPYVSQNRTCIRGSTENSLPIAPIPFSTDPSSEFYKMVNQVVDASKSLTEDQRQMALFWDDFPDNRYYGAPGHWASIFKQVLDSKKLSLVEGAEAYLKMTVALMDGFNGCFAAKYHYNVLRPVTYVNKYISPDWKPLIVTPSHPEYPAAHASISMAAAVALTSVLGNDVSFTDRSYEDVGLGIRTFKNFEEAGKEAGLSRLYGGIHYRPSIEAGYVLGRKVAENVLAKLKTRNANPSATMR
ncbi:MAG TPA: vanadium-dependent haloperoxidase, partial [Chryseosolibacter sp.]|nr:vanadium-dependent haloperoxidase [Chryseosolibacter sp.]